MEDLINKSAPYIFGFFMIIPLIFSIPFLFKIIIGKSDKKNTGFIESPFDSKLFNLISKKIIGILGLIVSCYLIVLIISLYWLNSRVLFPFPWNIIGMVLLGLYGGCFACILGLKDVGGAGGSPSKVVTGLFSMFSKKDKTNNKR